MNLGKISECGDRPGWEMNLEANIGKFELMLGQEQNCIDQFGNRYRLCFHAFWPGEGKQVLDNGPATHRFPKRKVQISRHIRHLNVGRPTLPGLGLQNTLDKPVEGHDARDRVVDLVANRSNEPP